MANKIVFKDIHPRYDGEYEFDWDGFTYRELHTIKRVAGVRVGELQDALQAGDTDVTMAVGIIALQRHGKEVDEDVLWDAKAGVIQVVFDEDDAESADPPAGQPLPGSGSSISPSGSDTNGSSGQQVNGQSRTGSQLSDTPATSEFETLAT